MTTEQRLIAPILSKYFKSFKDKTYSSENNDRDILMDVFDITPSQKRENRQYWGRELGMMWQLIVTEIAKKHCADFGPALKYGDDEPCDLTIGEDAIDTKYRIGSGDSGTLKKFKQYGRLLRENGYRPVFLIIRRDNLPTAITACYKGGWEILIGDKAFAYLFEKTGVDIAALLRSFEKQFSIA